MNSSRPDPAPAALPARPSADPRQRWRIAFRRDHGAPALEQREQLALWEAGLTASGLPLQGLELPVPRPRLVFGAPLPVGMPAERELLDLFLIERRPVAEIRAALASALPAGHELVDIHDIWLGEPALPAQVVAADYLVALDGGPAADEAGFARLRAAVERFLAASSLPRTREKSGRSVEYDLRPLVADLQVVEGDAREGGSAGAIRMRTRFDPERGVGRPEEVVAALSEMVGVPLIIASVLRERVVLAGES